MNCTKCSNNSNFLNKPTYCRGNLKLLFHIEFSDNIFKNLHRPCIPTAPFPRPLSQRGSSPLLIYRTFMARFSLGLYHRRDSDDSATLSCTQSAFLRDFLHFLHSPPGFSGIYLVAYDLSMGQITALNFQGGWGGGGRRKRKLLPEDRETLFLDIQAPFF